MKYSIMTVWALAALAMSACQTDRYPMPEQQALLKSDPSQSAIVFSVSHAANCSTTQVAFRNVRTGAVFAAEIWPPAAGIVVVPKGTYEIMAAACDFSRPVDVWTTAYGNQSLNGIAEWYDPFAVNDGEVVYIGTLRTDPFHHYCDQPSTSTGSTTPTLNAAIRVSEGAIYSVIDEGDKTRSRIARKDPAMAERMVSRVIVTRYSKQATIDLYRPVFGGVCKPRD